MLRSLYSGVSGMKGFQFKLDVIGNNIANVNTVGYKKGRVMFQDALSQNLAGASAPIADTRGGVNPRQVGLGVNIGAIDTMHTDGSPMTTGHLLDLTIEGDGFFVVQDGADGQRFLTRAGNFYLDAEDQLVTAQGYFVLDDQGDIITIDRDTYAAYDIGQNGQIVGLDAAEQLQPLQTIGLVIVKNPGGLRKVGSTMYQLTSNADLDDLDTLLTNVDTVAAAGYSTKMVSGRLEMSNVDLTEEFTEMIVAQRGFQSNARIITTSDEILQEVVNLKR